MFKKFILLAFLSLATFTSCSSDNGNSNSDGSPNQNTQGQITPPSWIIGEWGTHMLDTFFTYYSFASDEICHLYSPTICYQESLDYLNQNGHSGNVIQQISDTEYICIITWANTVTKFHFVKIDETTIMSRNDPHYNKDVLLDKR